MKKARSEPKADLSLRVALPTLRERTLDVLREAICNLQFAPGERLIERKLCEQTGVSRTSIREALRHLESEGLVKNIARRGPSVVEISVEEARQIYQLRGAIESLAGSLFAQRATSDDIRRLDRCISTLKQATQEKNLARSLKANEEFYEIIFDGSGNEVAAAVSKSLRAKINLLRAQATARWDKNSNRESVQRMEKIMDTIRSGDAEGARLALQDHASRSADTLLKVLIEKDRQAA